MLLTLEMDFVLFFSFKPAENKTAVLAKHKETILYVCACAGVCASST